MKRIPALLVALFVSTLTFVPPAASAVERPNILMVLTDDQRARDSFETMSEVRKLGTEGAVFDNAFATTPFCCPSRASVFTGLYAHNHHIKNGNVTVAQYNYANNRSVVKDFDMAGYQTAFYGKYLNLWPGNISPVGFDDWAIMPSVFSWYNGEPWNVNGVQEPQDGTYSTHYIRDHGLSFLASTEADDAAPWMMMLDPITPHSPATPEPAYADLPVSSFTPPIEKNRNDKPAWLRNNPPIHAINIINQRTKMLRALKSIDDMLGTIRQQLVATGEENTIIVFTSDNGLQWGEHGLSGKTTPYIPSVRVPLYVSWPGHIPVGHRSNLVGLLDLMPTFLSLTGVPSNKVLDGRNIFGAARTQILLEFWSWPGFYVPTWEAFLTPSLEFIEYYRLDNSYLTHEAYNMVRDPKQLTNLYRDGRPGNDPPSGSHLRLRSLAICDGTACP